MSRLRAVFVDGKKNHEGSVKGMWSSGLILEIAASPPKGTTVALVLLSGGFDGERIAAKVTSVDKNTVMIDLASLDTARFARLSALVDGKISGQAPLMVLPVEAPLKAPPNDAPTIIISGGEDALGDATDVQQIPKAKLTQDEIEAQLLELMKRNTQLTDENMKLKTFKDALQDELKDALSRLESIEKLARR